MKRAWLILDTMCPKSIQQQEAELIACCKERDIQIIGKSTYGIRFCAEVSEIMSIARLAVQNQCDYVAAADESCITDDYGVLVRSFLPFEKDGLTLYTADKGEILSEFFKQWPFLIVQILFAHVLRPFHLFLFQAVRRFADPVPKRAVRLASLLLLIIHGCFSVLQ